MKALHQMNNIEKGKLLVDLFPGEVKEILKAMEEIYNMLLISKEDIGRSWSNPFISLIQWYELADLVKNEIDKNGAKLLSGPRFANVLFYGYKSFFTIDCILKFAEKERYGSKFWHMSQALFKFE